MQNDENWESEIDWSRRTSVVGGPIFYEFIKAQALPTLDEGILALEATKASCEDRMRRWGGIAERAEKLSASFVALTECEDFMTLIHDFDKKTAAIFAGERIWTLTDWLRIGKRLTDAMRDGSSVPTKYASELADVKRDIANASAVRNILRSFVSASDNDYRLRCAPEKYRTRIFRDLAQDFGNIVESAATVNIERIPDFLHGIGEALKVIIEVAEKMQGICRWYPPTSEARSRRRRWLQGCEEGHEAPRQQVLGEARRVERHAKRHLTRKVLPSRRSPPRCRVSGILRSVGQPPLPTAKAPHRATSCANWPFRASKASLLLVLSQFRSFSFVEKCQKTPCGKSAKMVQY